MHFAIKFNGPERAAQKMMDVITFLESLRNAAKYVENTIREGGAPTRLLSIKERFILVYELYKTEYDDDEILEWRNIVSPVSPVNTRDFNVLHDGILSGYVCVYTFHESAMENMSKILSADSAFFFSHNNSDLNRDFFTQACVNHVRQKYVSKEIELLKKRVEALKQENNRLRKEVNKDVRVHKV